MNISQVNAPPTVNGDAPHGGILLPFSQVSATGLCYDTFVNTNVFSLILTGSLSPPLSLQEGEGGGLSSSLPPLVFSIERHRRPLRNATLSISQRLQPVYSGELEVAFADLQTAG